MGLLRSRVRKERKKKGETERFNHKLIERENRRSNATR